jgi:hypothetical protein
VVELVSLLSLGIFPATLHGVVPDLASAPPPKLSQTAWHELLQSAGAQESVTLHAQITASHGAVRQVDIQEVKEWPRTSTEVQTWIRQKWDFVSGFTGTVVQPISLKLCVPRQRQPRSRSAPNRGVTLGVCFSSNRQNHYSPAGYCMSWDGRTWVMHRRWEYCYRSGCIMELSLTSGSLTIPAP